MDNEPETAQLADDRDALLRASQRFRWLSQVEAPDAPGFYFFAGEINAADFGHCDVDRPTTSLSGKGLIKWDAFAGCVAEGIEHLSRLEWGDEGIVQGTPEAVSHGHDDGTLAQLQQLLGQPADAGADEIDWLEAVRLGDGAKTLVPADLCLRRLPGHGATVPPSAISTGCAAGPTRAKATLAALLELAERDAVALWWRGRRRARPLSLELLAGTQAASVLERLRAGTPGRHAWLLDITTDLDIPCFAAVSVDATGRGFAAGFAAQLDPAAAMRAALLELCQSELGYHFVAAKRQARGEAALNEADRRKLRQGREIDADTFDPLHPAGSPREHTQVVLADVHASADASIAIVLAKLDRLGVAPLVVDLTRADLAVPAVRALAPGLQPFPSSVATARLETALASTESRACEGAEVPLF